MKVLLFIEEDHDSSFTDPGHIFLLKLTDDVRHKVMVVGFSVHGVKGDPQAVIDLLILPERNADKLLPKGFVFGVILLESHKFPARFVFQSRLILCFPCKFDIDPFQLIHGGRGIGFFVEPPSVRDDEFSELSPPVSQMAVCDDTVS